MQELFFCAEATTGNIRTVIATIATRNNNRARCFDDRF
jgi:hypothetical protein